MNRFRPRSWITLSLLALAGSGCSGRPSALQAPSLDPAAAADNAIQLYDEDGDSKLNAAELQAAPGLAGAIGTYDKDGDAMIARDEIQGRLAAFVRSRAALVMVTASVTLDGKPLSGAQVQFVPEPYLGDELKVVEGLTGPSGTVKMSVPDEQLPENQRGIGGVQCGTYRVKITHPEISIPAKFNEQTTLGYETSFGQRNVSFAITSK